MIDTEGRRLTDAYDSLSYMKKSGMWMASEGSERIFLNDDGEIQETFEIPEDRHIMSADDGIITVMDLTLPEEAAGSWWETYTGDVFIYDEEGNLLGSFFYPEYPTGWQPVNSCIISFQNGRYIFRKDGKQGALDTSGQVVIEPEFEWIDYFSDNGYAVAAKDGKYGLIDKDGNTVVDFVYDNISMRGESSEPYYNIEQDGKRGIMDRNGRIVKEPVLSGCEVSNTQGGAFYVDRTGRTVMAASPQEDWRTVQAMHEGMAIVASGVVPESLQSGYQSPVTREEFCELACSLLTSKAVELPEEDSENPNPFTDSDSESVYALSRLGVIDGCGNSIFDPDAAITR